MLTVRLLAFLSLAVAAHAQFDMAQLWYHSPVYYPLPTEKCPPHPRTLCDFYFDGYENAIPTFFLDDGQHGDHAIVPISKSRLGWIGSTTYFSPGLKVVKYNQFVLANSMNGTFLRYPEGTFDEKGAKDTFDQFYMNANRDAISRLFVRTWQVQSEFQNGRGFYERKCIFLPFSAVMIQNTNINLNGEDEFNKEFPYDRRCVVFKTLP